MSAADLLKAADVALQEGQSRLAHCLKQLVSRHPSPVVERLDFADDRPFLEPSLFNWFAGDQRRLTLDQILYGYLPAESRPPSLSAYSDDNGMAYLPSLGWLATGDCGATTVTSREFASLTPLQRLPGTDAELCTNLDPLASSLLDDLRDSEDRPELVDYRGPVVNEAVNILGRVSPELFDCLRAVTRRVVVFRSSQLNSFATIRAHGAAFINVGDEPAGPVFFLEDLAHQCGHVLFNAMTVNRGTYFQTAPDTPLRDLGGSSDDERDLYTAAHGVFTEALMCIALDAARRAGLFDGEQQTELSARLSFVMKRFHLDLLPLQREGLFTDRGLAVFRDCGAVFDMIYGETADGITRFDFRNQPYTFSMRRFVESN